MQAVTLTSGSTDEDLAVRRYRATDGSFPEPNLQPFYSPQGSVATAGERATMAPVCRWLYVILI